MTNPYRFIHRLRVRWGECDMQGIVFNPHYMAFVDVALTEYWRTIGLVYPDGWAAQGTDLFMVAASQRYADAARYDDLLDVALRTGYLGTTSLRFCFEIRREAAVLFEGQATYVVADRTSRRPRPIGSALLERILAFEAVTPDRKPEVPTGKGAGTAESRQYSS